MLARPAVRTRDRFRFEPPTDFLLLLGRLHLAFVLDVHLERNPNYLRAGARRRFHCTHAVAGGGAGCRGDLPRAGQTVLHATLAALRSAELLDRERWHDGRLPYAYRPRARRGHRPLAELRRLSAAAWIHADGGLAAQDHRDRAARDGGARSGSRLDCGWRLQGTPARPGPVPQSPPAQLPSFEHEDPRLVPSRGVGGHGQRLEIRGKRKPLV